MENFCKGTMLGLVSGIMIGGIIVAKNKNLASKIKKGLGIAEEKMQEVKEFATEKIEETKAECKADCGCDDNSNSSMQTDTNLNKDSQNKDFNKKYKN